MQGADYVIATARPVLYMGGFNGNDQVVTARDLTKLVAEGQLRYVYWRNAEGRGMKINSEISNWVTSACKAVQGFDTTTQNMGAPDGTAAGQNNFPPRNFGGPQENMQVSLYDCANGG
jgi:hypothetical protein